MIQPLAFVIEDDPDAAAIFAEALEAAGYRTESIDTGDRALERLTVQQPDLVVLDMHLPNVEGGHILRFMRADRRLAATPVIIATADPRTTDDLDEQATLILLKPVSFSQLRDLVLRMKNIGSGGGL